MGSIDINTTEKKSKKTIKTFCKLFSFLIIFTFLLNILADPNRIFWFTTFLQKPNFMVYLPGDGGASNVMKAAGIIKYKPNTVILGTSVADNGSNTRGNFYIRTVTPTNVDMKFEDKYQPIFNAGVRGGGVSAMHEYFKHALLNNPEMKKIIISLEIGYFDSPNFVTNNSILHKDHISLEIFFERTLSASALETSLATSKLRCFYVSYNTVKAKLFIKKTNDSSSYPKTASLGNLPFTFMDDGRDRSSELFTSIMTAKENIGHTDPIKLDEGFNILKEIIGLAKKNNIEIDFFINPMSPYVYSVLERTNNLEVMRSIMYRLAYIIPYYDFYNLITNIEDTSINFIGQDVHYSRQVGDQILTILANKDTRERNKYIVNKKNIDLVYADKIKNIYNYTSNNKTLQKILYNSNLDLQDIESKGVFRVPVIYHDNYNGYRVIKIYKKYYAYPNNKINFDLTDILQNTNNNIIISENIADIMHSLSNKN